MPSIYVGFDPRETAAFAVCVNSIARRLSTYIPIYGLVLSDLQRAGLYTRPIETRPSAADKPVMWDTISDAPMSTQHANARFLVPHIARMVNAPHARGGWALFMDGDMMVTSDLSRMFESLDSQYAVYCVKHRHEPEPGVKMDGQQQTRYARKNWSSFMAFNLGHPSNRALTPALVNSVPGRDLHRFCWLKDDEIGELDQSYNFLVGHSDPEIAPDVIHFTDGVPDMAGYENVPFAGAWREELNAWARGNLVLPA